MINCVAYTDTEGAEAQSDLAYELNAEMVRRLGEVCEGEGVRLVHFSTDYVFDGSKEEGYMEEDKPNPLNVYGKSKLRGEEYLKEVGGDYLLVRTSFPFGRNERCFLQKMLKILREKGYARVVDGLVCAPTDFRELAVRVLDLLEGLQERGVYHLTNYGGCSRYEFVKEAVRVLRWGVEVERIEVGEIKSVIERPKYSVLLNTKLEQMLPWTEALEKYLVNNEV